MSQYERIVSYIYRYESGEKRENCGYAKVERRESECRIQIQTKILVPVSKAAAYLYIQHSSGIQTVKIGEMQIGRNEIRCKARTDVNNLFGSGKSFEQMDGIFVFLGTSVCFATTWTNDYFYLGNWKYGEEPENAQKYIAEEKESENAQKYITEEKKSENAQKYITEEKKSESMEEYTEGGKKSERMEEYTREEKESERMEEYTREEKESDSTEEYTQEEKESERMEEYAQEGKESESMEEYTQEGKESESMEECTQEETAEENHQVDTAKKEPERELQMQSVCGECPLKLKTQKRDYGHRILETLPTMYPFKDTPRCSCVKMDLQDIGCLPMRFWALSGNRFLLHGYYCYRHLLFMQNKSGGYSLGVPGIYNEKEKHSSIKYGFTSFRPLGESGEKGAFGYWLMQLSSQ